MDPLIIFLVSSWFFYFLIHSFLASITVKAFFASKFSAVMPYYRLTFNFLAVFLLIIPLWLTIVWSGEWLWQWTGVLEWLSHGISILAIVGFLWSLKFYDTSEFLGLRQLSENNTSVDDQEHFQLSPLHRFVRHPWYFFALVLIWVRDMNLAMLISTVMMSLYFIIGSWYEEKKLIRYHGKIYQRYRELVPGLIPLPWKFLSKTQMKKLLDSNDYDSQSR